MNVILNINYELLTTLMNSPIFVRVAEYLVCPIIQVYCPSVSGVALMIIIL